MTTAIFLALMVGIIIGIFTDLTPKATLPCDQCSLRCQCKKLEDAGEPNICTQKILRKNYGQGI